MKKLSILAGIILLFAACSNNELVNEQSVEHYAPVNVCVSGFSVSVGDFDSEMTRAAQSVADYANIKSITLAFYDAGGTEVYKSTQTKSDNTTYTTFGSFSCNLSYGNYSMVVVARNVFDNDVFTISSSTSASYSSDFVRETFAASQALAVNSSTPIALNVTLNRVVAMLRLNSTDNKLSTTTKVRTIYSAGSKSLNPTTGLAADNLGFTIVNTPSTAVGEKVTVVSFLFLETDEQTMDVTLEALDNNNQIVTTRVLSNVPFKRNKATIINGPVFTAEASTSSVFSVETEWLDSEVINF